MPFQLRDRLSRGVRSISTGLIMSFAWTVSLSFVSVAAQADFPETNERSGGEMLPS